MTLTDETTTAPLALRDPVTPPAADRSLPPLGRLALPVLSAIGERLASAATAMQRDPGAVDEGLVRLEGWGLQLQELAQVVARAAQLRREPVDLGLALLQTVAEWSAEAHRAGADLHGPAVNVVVDANPAALKHLLDLLLEHALQQGRSVRLEIDDAPPSAFVRVVAVVEGGRADGAPQPDDLAWQLLLLLARALVLAPERQPVGGGVRLVLPLPRAGAA